ncbi:GAF domain-containing sensor histidine kinase [Saccharopolyspora rosea]|uniref:Oxygen sensor histidine kinase NreB n=1 Tax=Saccharopolyspora rosea TaxID=524884 RepID=A0ABW3FNB4_9PSEU|nr:ATP-binding protein [Saccharopolyspora rosea]
MRRDERSQEQVRESLARLAELDRLYSEAATAGCRSLAIRRSVDRLLAEDADFTIAWIGVPDQESQLRIRAAGGTRTGLLRDLPVPRGAGLTGKVFARGSVEWVDEYFGSQLITHDFDREIDEEGVTRLIAVPIVSDSRTIGVLSAGVRIPGAFGSRAVERVVAVANSAALAASVAEREQRSAEIAAHEERRRMAVELHDTVGAMLFAIGAGARDMHEHLGDDRALVQRLNRIEEQAAEASRLLRESLRALRASPTELALSVALQADCHAFEERSGVRAHLVSLGDLPVLPQHRINVLLAAVREALLNVEKHAQATSVAVSVSVDDGLLSIAVTDDGVGIPRSFDPLTEVAAPESDGMGLRSVAESLARIGGTLQVRASADGGTVWRARVPV